MTHRRVLILACAGLFVPLLLPLWTGRLVLLDDLGAFHIPLRHIYREALHAGDSILWTRAFYSGVFLFGEGQAGMAHPLHVLLYRFLPLHAGLTLEMTCSYLAGLFGAAMFLERLGLARSAAWFGAMTFAFSGFNLLHVVHVNMVAVIAHAPWLLLATHVLLSSDDRRAQARAVAGIALLLGSQFLLGHPQMVWMTLVSLSLLVAGMLVRGVPRERMAWFAWAIAAGVAIGAVQWLPTLDTLRSSTRAVPSTEFRLSFSLPPHNLVQLVSPLTFESGVFAPPGEKLTHELSIYNGAFCTIALCWLAIRWRALRRRPLAGALLGLAVVAVLLALGRHAGVYALLVNLPGLSAFRAPARYVVLVHMALAGLAAIAFDDIVRLSQDGPRVQPPRMWPLGALALTSIAMAVVTPALAGTSWAAAHGLHFAGLAQTLPWALLLAAVATVVAMAARGARWAGSAIVLLAALDLGVWGYSDYLQAPSATVAGIEAEATVPPEARPGELFEPLRQSNSNNLAALRGVPLPNGYLGLEPGSEVNPMSPAGLRIAGAVWRRSGAAWERASNVVPRVRLMSHVRQSSDIAADAAAVDLATVALVRDEIGPFGGEPGLARVVSDRPGLLRVEVVAPERQLLVTTERYHEGWTASASEGGCSIVRVYGDYLGCVVGPGSSVITFSFQPPSVRVGAAVSAVGLVLLGLSVVIVSRRSGSRHGRV